MNFGESLALKAVSLLLALILWVTILSFKQHELKKRVRLEPMLPPGMMLMSRIPSEIQFVLVGSRIALKEAERKIQPIRPDLRRMKEGPFTFSISEELLGELPSNVKITYFYPASVDIRLEEVVERQVPVRPRFKGAPEEGYEIGTIKTTPSKVTVSGAKTSVSALEFVETEEMDIQDLKGTKEATLALEVDTNQGFQLSRERVVQVQVSTKKSKTR